SGRSRDYTALSTTGFSPTLLAPDSGGLLTAPLPARSYWPSMTFSTIKKHCGTALERASAGEVSFPMVASGSLALHLLTLGLLGQQHSLDVGQDAALSDGHFPQQLV
ncbi:hypothetical protein H1C71_013641, partial [Ictidomys tridecemlineatus]